MTPWSSRVALALAALVVASAVVFLVNTPYLSVGVNTVVVSGYLAAIYVFARKQFGLRVPLVLLALVFLALQVDALGNYFHLYRPDTKPIRYDEFAHLIVQTLIMPMIVWIALRLFETANARLPFWLVNAFAGALMFSLSAFYEVIEYWDDTYFGGRRIWSIFDTAEDLQWDFVGILLGLVLARLLLRRDSARRSLPY